MVPGDLSVPGCPTNLDKSREGPTALAKGAGWGCLDIFLSSIFSLFSLPPSERRSDNDCNTVSKSR